MTEKPATKRENHPRAVALSKVLYRNILTDETLPFPDTCSGVAMALGMFIATAYRDEAARLDALTTITGLALFHARSIDRKMVDPLLAELFSAHSPKED